MTTLAWDDLSKSEQAEVRRLHAKHRDLAKHGARVLEFEAEKKRIQDARQDYVTRHGLSCFVCGTTWAEWAAGSKEGRRWVICTTCVRKPR